MSLLHAWIVFPAVALLVALGLGLLAERAAGERLPGVLLLPLGMAGVAGLTQLPTYSGTTAELTLPLLVVAAAAGLWLGRERLRERGVDRWAASVFVAVVALYGAPVILTGTPTFLGYTILGDTSIHFIGADALLTFGRDFAALPPSSYEYSLVAYYGANAYPSGGPTAAGALTMLAGIDVAWSFQVLLSLLSALSGLCLYSLAAPLVRSNAQRAAVAFLAATPALSVAYAWQGSVKEVGTAFGVILTAALIPPYLRERKGSPRRAIPLAVAAGATVGIVGPAAAVWLGPLTLGAFLLARLPWTHAIVFAGVVAALSYQMLVDLLTYVDIAGGVVTAQKEFGNLLGELRIEQALGIWLTGDYRVPVTARATINDVLMAAVAIAGIGGIAHSLRRRAWPLALFLGVSGFAFWYVYRSGSPWADGKALMIVSPAVMLAAGVGAAWLGRAGWAVLAVLGLGVLWTNALQYHDASPAPYDRMSELDVVGERIDGEGPTFYPEFEEFAKHFLRQGDPEGAGEGWQRRFDQSGGWDGSLPRFGFAQDVDFFKPSYIANYRTIVLRKGFQSSRPPSNYERTFAGDFYEIWQRTGDPVEDRLHVGQNRQPAATAECKPLGALRGRGSELAYVERPPNILFDVASQPLPRGWSKDVTDGATVILRGAGRLQGTVTVPEAGRYDVWVEISDRREWELKLGDRTIPFRARLNSRAVAEHVGTVELEAGALAVELNRPGGSLIPGDSGYMRMLGPLALTPADPGALPVQTAPASDYRDVCGRSVDWVDVTG